MAQNPNIEQYLRLSPVMPVVTIDDAGTAVDLARALVRGGIRVIEVTLRTPQALRAIEEIAYALGFSEGSSFRRAFHRWASVTPARYRERIAGKLET